MANEIVLGRESGGAYFVTAIRKSDFKVWYPTGVVWETYGTGARDKSDYGMIATEKTGTGIYTVDFTQTDAAILCVYIMAGANPAETDTYDGAFDWRINMGYVPNRGSPVLVQARDAIECAIGLAKAVGSITFAANATDTKVAVVCGTTFEFLDDIADVGVGNVAVQIGADAEETRDNLLAALPEIPRINSEFDRVVAEASSTDAILLTYWEVGTVGNITITTDDVNITVAGLAGGADGTAI